MELEGRIIQIMKKNKLRSYFFFHIPKEVRGKDILIVERKDIPQKTLRRFLFFLRHFGKEFTWWILVEDSEDLKEGDLIEAQVQICYDNAIYLIGETIEKKNIHKKLKTDNYPKEKAVHA